MVWPWFFRGTNFCLSAVSLSWQWHVFWNFPVVLCPSPFFLPLPCHFFLFFFSHSLSSFFPSLPFSLFLPLSLLPFSFPLFPFSLLPFPSPSAHKCNIDTPIIVFQMYVEKSQKIQPTCVRMGLWWDRKWLSDPCWSCLHSCVHCQWHSSWVLCWCFSS